MPLRIAIDLTDQDLKHFKSIMSKARKSIKDADRESIIGPARDLLGKVKEINAPDFISDRLGRLKELIDMVEDEGWAMPAEDCKRVLSALAYFSDPEDMIPDSIPGLGFLDDAIMVELVVRELKHEVEAYQDFCKFREAEADRRKDEDINRASWLADRRKQLHSRMRRRRGRAGSGGQKSPFRLL